MQPKRILITLLVVILAVSLAGLAVSAEGTKYTVDMAVEASSSTAISENPLKVNPGDTVSVSVTIDNNPGLCAIRFGLVFDKDALEPASSDAYTISDKFAVADMATISIKDGFINVSLFNSSDMEGNGTVITFNFIVKDTFDGDVELSLDMDSADLGKEGIYINSKDKFIVNTESLTIGAHNYGEPVVKEPTCTEVGRRPRRSRF